MPYQSSQHSGPSPPRWPQYSLRGLLVGVAVCGVIALIMGEIGPAWSIILGWFLVMAAVHVAGTSTGTVLRQHHHHRHPDEGPPDHARKRGQTVSPCAVSPHLRTATRLGRKTIVPSALGAVVAGVAVTWLLIWLAWDRAGYAGVLLGGCSAALIGGLFGFLASSFVGVFWVAWAQASGEHPPANAVDASN